MIRVVTRNGSDGIAMTSSASTSSLILMAPSWAVNPHPTVAASAMPLIAGIALAATVGCGFTAQLGAMRISEEVDALEVMAIPSLPFLVTTRIIAGLVAVVPLYVIGLFSSYFATRLIVTGYYG